MKNSLNIFVVCLLSVLGFSLGWYTTKSRNKGELVKVDTIYVEKPLVSESGVRQRVWRSSEIGLPPGIVIDGECDNSNSAINWLSIQQSDGNMVIVKNIDGQLWAAINANDLIE